MPDFEMENVFQKMYHKEKMGVKYKVTVRLAVKKCGNW